MGKRGAQGKYTANIPGAAVTPEMLIYLKKLAENYKAPLSTVIRMCLYLGIDREKTLDDPISIQDYR